MGQEQTKRLILITGTTKGLGLAMAEKFIALGHTIVGCGRSENEIAKLSKHFGRPHDFEAVDVSSDSMVKRWAARVLAELGTPDLLINNAATINKLAPLWDIPAEEFSSTIDINIKGVANVIRHFVPAMIKRGTGVIVNFSSGWGRSTSAGVAPYCATKYAIEGLTKALAHDLPAGMVAVPLNPGIINTEMLQTCFGRSASAYPEPKDWADDAVPFILGLGQKDNGQSLDVV
jgi:NAD(P)-dependent dehydrogenase (short-subunit alcohol dehydrogenase family)